MRILASGFLLDTTIHLENVVTFVTMLIVAIVGWRDITWRVKNLESWRTEHMIDSDARDLLIKKMDTMLERQDVLIQQQAKLLDQRWRGEFRNDR